MKERPIIACRGDDEPLIERVGTGITLLSDIEVYGQHMTDARPATRELKAGGGEDTNAHRLELIQQISDGKRLEIVVKRALTYRQSTKPGKPNRRGLRFSAEGLAEIAPTFKGQPFLVDHNTYEQSARKGTLLSSELGENRGSPALFQSFSVVKPDAAISVLDGTIDRFSIGWFPSDIVLCTVHGCDVRSKDSCYCWPLEQIEIDGKMRIAEFEYQAGSNGKMGPRGKELSSVNVPAVEYTKIEEYHAALTAELDLPPKKKERQMAFHRLAAALGLTALSEADESSAVAAVEALSRRATTLEQERNSARSDLAAAQTQLAAAQAGVAAAGKLRIDALIAQAYRDGKLRAARDEAGQPIVSKREARLRRIAAEKNGITQLQEEIDELDVIVPVGQRLASDDATAPDKKPLLSSGDEALDAELENVAAQLGLKVEDMRSFNNSSYIEEG